eukprot:8534510-Pyramimonas_sp.AAC.2
MANFCANHVNCKQVVVRSRCVRGRVASFVHALAHRAGAGVTACARFSCDDARCDQRRRSFLVVANARLDSDASV